jgi:hypothetical protein
MKPTFFCKHQGKFVDAVKQFFPENTMDYGAIIPLTLTVI